MLDYKDIIIKHYGGGMSGSELAAKGLGSKSGINDFLRAFEACEKIGYALTCRIEAISSMIIYWIVCFRQKSKLKLDQRESTIIGVFPCFYAITDK